MKGTLFLLFCLILSSCSVLRTSSGITKSDTSKIVFDHPVTIFRDGKPEKLNAFKELTLKDSAPLLTEAEGRTPMILVPIGQEKSKFQLSLPLLDKSKITEAQNLEGNKALDSILHKIQQVQFLILKKDYNNALMNVKSLKTKYPEIAFLSFIEGSCYELLGQKENAISAVRDGLRIYPESSDAKELYKRLTGREF